MVSCALTRKLSGTDAAQPVGEPSACAVLAAGALRDTNLLLVHEPDDALSAHRRCCRPPCGTSGTRASTRHYRVRMSKLRHDATANCDRLETGAVNHDLDAQNVLARLGFFLCAAAWLS